MNCEWDMKNRPQTAKVVFENQTTETEFSSGSAHPYLH